MWGEEGEKKDFHGRYRAMKVKRIQAHTHFNPRLSVLSAGPSGPPYTHTHTHKHAQHRLSAVASHFSPRPANKQRGVSGETARRGERGHRGRFWRSPAVSRQESSQKKSKSIHEPRDDDDDDDSPCYIGSRLWRLVPKRKMEAWRSQLSLGADAGRQVI